MDQYKCSPGYKTLDPYPFILLNLLLSTIAALQAPVILMSQNRKGDNDRKPAINDYLLILKSEIEIRNFTSQARFVDKRANENNV